MGQNGIPYCGAAPPPADWMSRWNTDPLLLVLFAIVVAAAWYRGGIRPTFWAGLALLFLLFVSPLCALSSALFSVRVAHHVLLTAAAAPLLVMGMPRLRVGGSPALWAALHIIIFWFWHAPAPYALALGSDFVFWTMQTSLLASAIAVWVSLRRASAPTAISLLLVIMVQMGLLGALITFAGSPLYAPHYLTTQPWGFAPLEDQQLAGLIMWAPAAGFYLAAALWRGWTMLAPAPAAAR